MTTRALAAPPARPIRAAVLAGLAGVLALHLTVLAWSLLSHAVWGPAWRLSAFLEPTAVRPTGYLALSLLFTVAAGAGLGAGLARALARGVGVARWRPWIVFAAGVGAAAAGAGALTLWAPALLLLLAASALGFRVGARG